MTRSTSRISGSERGPPRRQVLAYSLPTLAGACQSGIRHSRNDSRPCPVPRTEDQAAPSSRPIKPPSGSEVRHGIVLEGEGRMFARGRACRPASMRCLRGVREHVQPQGLHGMRSCGVLRIAAGPQCRPLPPERASGDQVASARSRWFHMVLPMPALHLRGGSPAESAGWHAVARVARHARPRGPRHRRKGQGPARLPA